MPADWTCTRASSLCPAFPEGMQEISGYIEMPKTNG